MAISIGTCVSDGVTALKRNPVYCIVGGLIIGLGGGMSAQVLAGPLTLGFYRGLEKEEKGGRAELGDLFTAFDDIVPPLIAGLIAMWAMVVGSYLCLIPGLLVAPLMPLAMHFIAAGEKDGMNALKRAWAALKPQLVPAAIAAFVLMLVAMLGIVACCIGVLITAPIYTVGMRTLAKQIIGDAPAAPAAPATTTEPTTPAT